MLDKILNIIKTEPAMITAIVQAILGVVVSFGFSLTAAETGSIMAVTTALLALVTALSARPVAVSAFTGLVSAIVTLLVAFGVHGIQPDMVASVNTAIVAISALVLRGHITPVATLRAAAGEKVPPAPPAPATVPSVPAA